ncbi:hypothetical protein [Virgibacillus sp. L01]|uniref:hypothetical protein n=1 Tax=Virgibacillus sp. L01 TaxID=3457429 RepID=UPI003FD296EE
MVLVFTVTFATFFLFNMSASAEVSDKQDIDAFNQKLEKQKISELVGKNSEDGFAVKEGEPLTIDFEDGSSVTYEVTVEPANKSGIFATTQGTINYSAKKTYTWGLGGSASVRMHIDNVRSWSDRLGDYLSTSDSNDYQSIESTTFATVNRGSTISKDYWADTHYKGIKGQAEGVIKYNIAGVHGQKSYRFSIKVDPRTPWQVEFISNGAYY